MKGTVLYEVKEEVAILTVDNPPVNPLSDGVRTGLYESLVKAEEDDSVKGVVLTGNGRAFIAGAEIKTFLTLPFIWFFASTAFVNIPVHSNTISTSCFSHGIFDGVLSL